MAKKVLGRGLGAFFPDMENQDPQKTQEYIGQLSKLDPKERVNVILHIPVESIRPNPHQPRQEFDEFRLKELSDSIQMHGLIQPITARYLGEDRYELVSGERRLRATRMAGIGHIPAYIREVNDDDMIAFALIENVQREQLNPIEIAVGYKRLIEECELTQEEVARRVGKNRTTVTNMLRLLNLPPTIQSALKRGQISTGHARALINVEDADLQDKLLRKTIEDDYSVRQIEDAVRNASVKKTRKTTSKASEHDIAIREISNRLRRQFATKVDIRKKNKGGEIRIEYYSDDELERILNLFDNIQPS
ncbi:MAG: ParB/RepB/Spo0J family partition protein [Balneolaceae bacterium]|jgi:ParB family chromosome partitioning protein|nr:MAG: ParB/RepB/Spo0J family partition protein [Balneolaceae bacterium]